MRHSLEQLKAMSDDELRTHWFTSQFPFERIPSCYGCMTVHGGNSCKDKEHFPLREQVNALDVRLYDAPWDKRGQILRQYLEPLYALRLFYDSLYPQPALEAVTLAALSAEISRTKEELTAITERE